MVRFVLSSAVVRATLQRGWRLPLMGRLRGRSASGYQLDFVTPGSWPSRARSRKQIRHIAKRRM